MSHAPNPVRAGVEQPGFTDTVVLSGLNQPTAVEFASDGRVFVAEKSGIVRVFSSIGASSSTVFADLRPKVHNYWDRGLLGLALHPQFPSDNRVYVLYSHDAAIGGTAPRWGDTCPSPPGGTADGCVVSGRLSVLTASGNVSTGEQVLIEDWCQQYPSHSIGDLVFGPSGELYASGGDGASFTFGDYGQDGNPVNPCGDPPGGVGGSQTIPSGEGGGLRSQDLRTMSDPVGLDGTIIRINPNTGAGASGNPLAASPDANARRIVASGLRNPFRFTVRPGTNEVWIGDVGAGAWEEINRIANPLSGPANFAWPCIEGTTAHPSTYRDMNICTGLYAAGPSAVVPPHFTYRHGDPVANESCVTSSGSSTSGLAFYEGGTYPAQYQGALFFSDYSRRCIWVMYAGSGGVPDPATRTVFISNAGGPVQLKIGPGGDLFYVDHNGGSIHRVQYTLANQAPVARIVATPSSGPAPLSVQFDGSTSTDADGQPLTYSWDLNGDSVYGDATGVTATQNYGIGVHTVRLRVADSLGATGSASIQIEATGTQATRYVSDLAFTREVNFWGPLERDRSNGEQGPADGHPITLNGVVYPKGVGMHAPGEFNVIVPPDCTRLRSDLGVDDEVGTKGSVRFEVWDGATRIFRSSLLTGVTATESMDISVTPGHELRMVLTTGDTTNKSYDHGDWADTRFSCEPPPGNTRPTARIDVPAVETTWAAGDTIFFQGRGTDAEDGTVDVGNLTWQVILHHCQLGGGCHEHTIQTFEGVPNGTFVTPDHEYPAHLELRLTVSDSGGLSNTGSLLLYPRTSGLTIQTQPAGLEVAVGTTSSAATPFTYEAIEASRVTLDAESPQTVNGTVYEFVSWSDGGARSHEVTVGAADATYTAVFQPVGSGATTRYVSDLAFTREVNFWGPLERDRSNGEQGPADGHPITLNGVVYPKGVGMHAPGEFNVIVPPDCTRLRSDLGVDDEVGTKGSVRFEVWDGATRIFRSSLLTGVTATESMDISVTPGHELRMVLTTGDTTNKSYDHGDWADTRFSCGPP